MIREVRLCKCGKAVEWDFGDEQYCQMCWEKECSRLWWAEVLTEAPGAYTRGWVDEAGDGATYDWHCGIKGKRVQYESAPPDWCPLPRFSGWQPIETAPKDRRAVLIWCPERKNIHAAVWDAHRHWVPFGGHCESLPTEPTHWMPLPDPPREIGGSDRDEP